MQKNIEKIKKKLKSKFYYDYEIYKHTWFRTGGKAYIFCLVYDEKELEIILNNIGDMKYQIRLEIHSFLDGKEYLTCQES